MTQENGTLWQIGMTAEDGRPYVDLEKATYIVGVIGLNECVQYLIDEELHDSEKAYKLGLKIIAGMNLKAKALQKLHGLTVTLEETPAESAARRLAKTDLQYFYKDAKDIVKGNIESDDIYYTNSVHIPAESKTGIVERIKIQGMFHKGKVTSGGKRY